MAHSHNVSSVSNIQDFTEQIQSLPISNDIRKELSKCLQSIVDIDLNSLHGISGSNSSNWTFNEVIILLNKFAKVTIDALEACELLPFPFGIICKVITKVVRIVFSKDVASVVINRFTAILEADLIAKCRATCTKITHCISYIQGLPEASQLQQEQRNLHLQLVASDVPIHIGLDEVLFLGEKIRDMVNVADLNRTNNLFEHTQLYCCLTTLRELFLLYRFAIQSVFSIDASSIRNVLVAQKTNDKEVLKFLYRPSTRTVRLFRFCFLNQWPILRYFLHRRGLHPENLSELSGKTVKIKSVNNSGKALRPSIHFVRFLPEPVLALDSDVNSATTLCELRGGSDNVFTLWSRCYNPPRQVYCDILIDSMSIRRGEPPTPPSSRWYVLKLQPEPPEELPCYMIWLEYDYKKCVKAFWNNNVGLDSTSEPGKRYFWKLEAV